MKLKKTVPPKNTEKSGTVKPARRTRENLRLLPGVRMIPGGKRRRRPGIGKTYDADGWMPDKTAAGINYEAIRMPKNDSPDTKSICPK